LSRIEVNLKLVKVLAELLELKHRQAASGMEASLSFGEIKLVNASD
jgi:hypothetical protein